MTSPGATMNRQAGLALPLVLASVLLGCFQGGATPVPYPPPSEAEALAYLDSVVDLAKSADPASVCTVGGGNCARTLREAGGSSSVPSASPIVLGSITIQPTRHPDGAWDTGGRLLFVCVRTDQGRTLETDVLVFRDETGRLISIDPVYWSGQQIGLSSVVSAKGIVRPTCPFSPAPSAS